MELPTGRPGARRWGDKEEDDDRWYSEDSDPALPPRGDRPGTRASTSAAATACAGRSRPQRAARAPTCSGTCLADELHGLPGVSQGPLLVVQLQPAHGPLPQGMTKYARALRLVCEVERLRQLQRVRIGRLREVRPAFLPHGLVR